MPQLPLLFLSSPARVEPGDAQRAAPFRRNESRAGQKQTGPPPPRAQAFFLLSNVRRKRNDSVPVSIICARSVTRSSSALHNRGFGNTVVHSENGRFVVRITAARSARSEIT